MSINYSVSRRLSFNVLVSLNNLQIEPKATFDFIDKTIKPTEAKTKESSELFNDYLNWLPEHFARHQCDITKLEALELTIWADFKSAKTPLGMSNCKEIIVHTLTKWKAQSREEQVIEISQSEIVKESFLKFGIAE